MYQETRSVTPRYTRKTLGYVTAVLFFTGAFLWPDLARSGGFHGGGFHGGGFHGGGFHGGVPAFHGGGFHPGLPAFHGGGLHPAFREFHAGGFHDGHFRAFHDGRFHHHGFGRGVVVVPAFGGWWWGGGWGWPDYYYPYGGYYGYGPNAWYWCSDPPGYYPYVTQCNTSWQTAPAS